MNLSDRHPIDRCQFRWSRVTWRAGHAREAQLLRRISVCTLVPLTQNDHIRHVERRVSREISHATHPKGRGTSCQILGPTYAH